jgi:hypothetical protein
VNHCRQALGMETLGPAFEGYRVEAIARETEVRRLCLSGSRPQCTTGANEWMSASSTKEKWATDCTDEEVGT